MFIMPVIKAHLQTMLKVSKCFVTAELLKTLYISLYGIWCATTTLDSITERVEEGENSFTKTVTNRNKKAGRPKTYKPGADGHPRFDVLTFPFCKLTLHPAQLSEAADICGITICVNCPLSGGDLNDNWM